MRRGMVMARRGGEDTLYDGLSPFPGDDEVLLRLPAFLDHGLIDLGQLESLNRGITANVAAQDLRNRVGADGSGGIGLAGQRLVTQSEWTSWWSRSW